MEKEASSTRVYSPPENALRRDAEIRDIKDESVRLQQDIHRSEGERLRADADWERSERARARGEHGMVIVEERVKHESPYTKAHSVDVWGGGGGKGRGGGKGKGGSLSGESPRGKGVAFIGESPRRKGVAPTAGASAFFSPSPPKARKSSKFHPGKEAMSPGRRSLIKGAQQGAQDAPHDASPTASQDVGSAADSGGVDDAGGTNATGYEGTPRGKGSRKAGGKDESKEVASLSSAASRGKAASMGIAHQRGGTLGRENSQTWSTAAGGANDAGASMRKSASLGTQRGVLRPVATLGSRGVFFGGQAERVALQVTTNPKAL